MNVIRLVYVTGQIMIIMPAASNAAETKARFE